MLKIEVIKLTRLFPYGEAVKRIYSNKTTKGHPHNSRRKDGKPRLASTCKICRDERITRY